MGKSVNKNKEINIKIDGLETFEAAYNMPLVNLQNELINLWLPLTIDLQGLSQVEERRKHKYLKAINDDLPDSAGNMIKGWRRIKRAFEDRGVMLQECPIIIDNKSDARTIINYIEDVISSKDKISDLTKWLQTVSAMKI